MRRFLITMVAVATGCGGTQPQPPVVRDSSGVTIVDNFGPSWRDDQAWSLSDSPTLSLGDSTRGEEYVFDRVVGALRYLDGKIVVANSGTQELRWFDGGGSHLASVGRTGRGGISFTALDWLGRIGEDGILAYDRGNLRMSVFNEDGSLRHESSLILTFREAPGAVRGVFADSSLLVVRGARHWIREMHGQPNAPQGLRRGPTLAFRYSYEDGSFLNPLGSYSGSEQIFRTGRTQIVHVSPRPFGRNAVIKTKGNAFIVGTQDAYELSVKSNRDTLLTIVRLDRDNLAVTQEHIETYKNAMLANVHPRERADREARLDSLPFPDEMPAYSSLLVDTEGNLWVEDYRPFGIGRRVWNVFGSSYHLLGSVETPPPLTIFDIGSDYVLGRWRDADGSESIRVYELEKPQGE